MVDNSRIVAHGFQSGFIINLNILYETVYERELAELGEVGDVFLFCHD